MKSLCVEVPDTLAHEVAQMIQAGWFANEQEFLRAAIMEFVRHNRLELMERFQREDIAWALRQRRPKDRS
jgi:Arc/MetJ-type ribon-helix-helix transcriptional regulator